MKHDYKNNYGVVDLLFRRRMAWTTLFFPAFVQEVHFEQMKLTFELKMKSTRKMTEWICSKLTLTTTLATFWQSIVCYVLTIMLLMVALNESQMMDSSYEVIQGDFNSQTMH